MSEHGIQNIVVLGAGTMGSQIALTAALAGYSVSCVDCSSESPARARKFVDTYLPRRVDQGKLSPEVARTAGENLVFTPDPELPAAEADLVIESIMIWVWLPSRILTTPCSTGWVIPYRHSARWI